MGGGVVSWLQTIVNRLGSQQNWSKKSENEERKSAESYLRLDSVSLGGLPARGTHMQNRKVQIKTEPQQNKPRGTEETRLG